MPATHLRMWSSPYKGPDHNEKKWKPPGPVPTGPIKRTHHRDICLLFVTVTNFLLVLTNVISRQPSLSRAPASCRSYSLALDPSGTRHVISHKRCCLWRCCRDKKRSAPEVLHDEDFSMYKVPVVLVSETTLRAISRGFTLIYEHLSTLLLL